MGSGHHGGFGNTKGNEEREIVLPPNDSQLKHILRVDVGHLPDTPENRKLLVDLANDSSKYLGKDKWGNSWNARINEDGTQDWVVYRGNVIREGGKNLTPKPWNPETGLNFNPKKMQSSNPFHLILKRGDIAV